MNIMAKKSPQNLPFILFSLTCFLSNTLYCKAIGKEAPNKIKGMFVFGSSLVDNGNNNFLQNSIAKADYLPYGIDFPKGPSGRFTNGKNVIDLIGDQLHLPFIPPFTNPLTKGREIVNGVNYASGGSGILDETGSMAGVISLNQQIKSFEDVTLPDLENQLGLTSRESLPNYLFVVGSGGNDYTLNYFMSQRYSNISIQDFTVNLTAILSHQLKRLYDLGARKFVLMSLNPLGCGPSVRANQNMRSGCVRNLNQAAHFFNMRLKMLVDVIKPQMPGSTLVNVNAYKIIRDIIKNPASKGFNDTENSCCELGGTGVLCKRGGETCSNRNIHVYFDGLHPSESVNVLLATKAYASNMKAEVYPFNIKHLANI